MKKNQNPAPTAPAPKPTSDEANRHFEAVYKTVLYVHQEFASVVSHAFYGTRGGRHLFERVEDQLMRRYGISRFNNIYVQDEVGPCPHTGVLISKGPDAKTMDFVRCIGPDGNVDEATKQIYLRKYEQVQKKSNGKLRKSSDVGSVGPVSGGDGANASRDSQDSGKDA